MLIISKSTKQQIIAKLIDKYGENYKTPLAKELGVDVSTVRRMFNQRGDLSPLAKRAIICILEHGHLNDKSC